MVDACTSLLLPSPPLLTFDFPNISVDVPDTALYPVPPCMVPCLCEDMRALSAI